MCVADLVVEPLGHLLAGRHVGAAGIGRDREAGRHRHAERGHLREPDALAAEQLAAAGSLLVEVVDVAHRRDPRTRRRAAESDEAARGLRDPTMGGHARMAHMRGHIVAMGGGGFLGGRSSVSPSTISCSSSPAWRGRTSSSCRRRRATADRAVEAFESAWSPRTARRDVAYTFGVPERPAEQRRSRRRRRRRRRQHREHARGLARSTASTGPCATRWESGAVLGGVSAGANCWFEACVTDSFSVELDGLADGLGLPRRQLLPPLRRRGAPPAGLRAPRRATASRPGSRATTARPRCIAAPSSSRSSPTVPAPLGYRASTSGFEPLETRLLR